LGNEAKNYGLVSHVVCDYNAAITCKVNHCNLANKNTHRIITYGMGGRKIYASVGTLLVP
jgi:hypothetical protein